VPKQIFINLPVRDLKKATAFYAAIGFTQNPQFSDDTASCMILSDTIFVMLLTHAKWKTFTTKPIVDSHRDSEVALAFSVDDRSAVDKLIEAAAANGGKADVNPKQELPFMYSRSLEYIDGHVWEPLFFDMSQFPKG
jgi:uncharacterized protein